MHIKELSLQNFRCFEQLTIHFNPQMNVLIGDNASGKTAVLDALAYALAKIDLWLTKEKESFLKLDYGISEKDVRQTLIGAETEYPVENTEIILHAEKWEVADKLFDEVKWQLSYQIGNSEANCIDITNFNEVTGYLRSNINSPKMKTLPIIAYYPTNRTVKTKNTRVENKKELRHDGYEEALLGAVDIKLVSDRLQMFDYELFHLSQLGQLSEKVKNRYSALKAAIIASLPNVNNLYYSPKYKEIITLFQEDKAIPFRFLSKGYETMLSIIGDIAYRCTVLNPNLDDVLAQTPGVVLIDEIDLHLHPKWQKQIIENLKKVFPKIQFIVTTHSPFIIQSVKKEELHNLTNMRDMPTDEDPFKLSLEEVADYVQNIPNVERSERFQEMVKVATEYFELIEQQNVADNEEKILTLKNRLDELEILYNDDPYFVALLQMERKTKFNQHLKR
ncbi:MAG: AAA family ATPase [Bacteroidia bacterium]